MNGWHLDNWLIERGNLTELTRQSIEEMQLKKLNALLERIRNQSRFYTDLPAQLCDLEALESLPFTTSQDLINDSASLLLVSQGKVKRVITETTSGTTGQNKRVFYSHEDIERTLDFFIHGMKPIAKEGRAVIVAMPFSGEGGIGDLVAKALDALGMKVLKVGCNQSYGNLVEICKEEKPYSYVGMPVPLLSLLRFEEDISIEQALVSADVLPNSVKNDLEARLGSPVFESYASREIVLGGTVSCSHGNMHIREEHMIVEIIDEEGHVVNVGEEGEMVITSIGVDAMPLIRYRTGDIGKIMEQCPCGSPVKALESTRRIGNVMWELDNELFQMKELIDYSVKKTKHQIQVDAFVKCEEQLMHHTQEKIEIKAKLFFQMPVTVNIRKVTAQDASCYQGKRRIISSR